MSNQRIYFKHFDSLRFIAAIIIVFAHAVEGYGWFGKINSLTDLETGQHNTLGHYVYNLLGNLSIGVDLFFVLSGFLITYLLLEEKKRFGKISFLNFYIRRSFRIWPVFYLIIAVSPLLVKWVESTPEPNYLMNALFLGNFDAIFQDDWIYPFAHFWSICVEEHFYIFWPFIIAFVPVKRLLPVFGLIILCSIGFRVYACLHFEYPYMNLYLNTLSRMDVLVFGAAIAYFYSKKPFTFTLPVWLRYALFLLLVFFMAISPMYFLPTVPLVMFKKYLYVGIIVLLILDFQFHNKPSFRLFDNRLFSYLGKCSYGIYMYSNILIVIIVKHIMWPNDWSNLWLFLFFNFALTIVISILSYELMEKRLVKWSHRFRVLK